MTWNSEIDVDELPVFLGSGQSGIVPDPGTSSGRVLTDLGWETVSIKSVINLCVARNGNNAGPQFLRRQNGTPTNSCPYVVPFDSVIYIVTTSNNSSSQVESWDFIVEVNETPVITINNPSGTRTTVDDVSVNVSRGDRIRIRIANLSNPIDQPGGTIYLREL